MPQSFEKPPQPEKQPKSPKEEKTETEKETGICIAKVKNPPDSTRLTQDFLVNMG